jgi:predicted nucleic acid-binding protein
MKTIVSDTSPINYLVLIAEIDVLPHLFQEILIPPAVWQELQHPKTPKPVYDWAADLPAWAKIAAPLLVDNSMGLDPGETEAIALAQERKIPALLIDDRGGRLAAEQRAIVPIGTVNILEMADIVGLLDFEQAIVKLQATNFRIDKRTVEIARAQCRLRRSQG